MKLLFVLASALLLSSLAVATPDSNQLGPYTVSFDLNTNMQYEKQTAPSAQFDTANQYMMRIFTDNSTYAVIGVTQYKDMTDATLSMHKSLMKMEMAIGGLNATDVADRTIDGKNGFVVTFVPFAGAQSMPSDTTIYSAMYWLDSKDCTQCGPVSVGQTYVSISSSYPQDVTENLLNSLHVEMGQSAGAAAAGAGAGVTQDMPPSSTPY